jgi:hypothetical protein
MSDRFENGLRRLDPTGLCAALGGFSMLVMGVALVMLVIALGG